MSHLDDEQLAASAMGESEPAAVTHLRACETCQSEVAALRATLDRLERSGDPGELLDPPPSVWDGIAAQIAEPEPAASATPASTPDDELAGRRRRRAPAWGLLGAAAAGIVVGGVAVGAILGIGDQATDADVVAQTPLTDLATEADAGTAVLETRDDGTQVLVVDTDYAELEDAYLEVWLIDEEIQGMVSLGHLTGTQSEFVLPEGFDPADFPIVDISVEPLDGVPTHSGDSVTRGVLQT